jgi:hypothetical protein
MRQLCRWLVGSAAVVATLLSAGSGAALELSVSIGGDPYTLADLPVIFTGTSKAGGYVIDSNPGQIGNQPVTVTGEYSIGWSTLYNIDPFVQNNLNVTNLGALPLTVDVTVTTPVVPQTPNTQIQGSVGLTLTNTTGSASAGTSLVALYTALIDGVAVQTLFPLGYSLSCAPPFCSTTDSDDFGIPVAIGPFPQALSDIAIRIRFVLSPGDTLGVSSVFNIEAVPEPMTLGLLGVVLAGALAARRRA